MRRERERKKKAFAFTRKSFAFPRETLLSLANFRVLYEQTNAKVLQGNTTFFLKGNAKHLKKKKH